MWRRRAQNWHEIIRQKNNERASVKSEEAAKRQQRNSSSSASTRGSNNDITLTLFRFFAKKISQHIQYIIAL